MTPTHFHTKMGTTVIFRYEENGYVYFSWSKIPTMVVTVGSSAWEQNTIPLEQFEPVIRIYV